jgi:hypothetical protein
MFQKGTLGEHVKGEQEITTCFYFFHWMSMVISYLQIIKQYVRGVQYYCVQIRKSRKIILNPILG